MNKRFKEFLDKCKQFINGILCSKYLRSNEHPFLGGFFTGGIFTLLMEIILVLILR